jgi:hypothetical protein
MDETTKKLVDDFMSFLANELLKSKEFKHIQIERTSLKDNKLTIHFIHNNKIGEVFVDLREIKDNKNHFLHLLGNVLDQVTQVGKED